MLIKHTAPEDDMAWVKPKFSRNKVDQAGDAARRAASGCETADVDAGYLDVISNWRSSHSYPLSIIQGLLRRHAVKIDPDAVIGQRLKRFDSIINKLVRYPTTELSQIQDIAGCRAVVGGLDDVWAIRDRILGAPIQHELLGPRDYISNPKPDGYRSIHAVFKFSGSEGTEAWNKQRVEIQVRTKLQHIWATTLETVDAFTGQALKSNRGSAEWQEFFVLMSAAFAMMEGCPVPHGAPNNMADLRSALEPIAKKLKAEKTIAAFRATANYSGTTEAHYYLMRLDPSSNDLAVRRYAKNKSAQASEDYLLTEKDAVHSNEIVVLVSADSLQKLKKAYPNYFPNTGTFIKVLRASLRG